VWSNPDHLHGGEGFGSQDPPCSRRREEGPVLPRGRCGLSCSSRWPLHRDPRPVHPRTDPSTIELNLEKVDAWIAKGAQPSETVAKLIAIAKNQEAVVPAKASTLSKKAQAKVEAEEKAAAAAAEAAKKAAAEAAEAKAAAAAAPAEAEEAPAEAEDAAVEVEEAASDEAAE